MATKLLRREEVDPKLTWDLTAIYPTEQDMENDLAKVEQAAREIVEKYQGKLTDVETIENCLTDYAQIQIKNNWIRAYGSLSVSGDYTNSKNQQMSAKAMSRLSALNASLSFIKSEIIENDLAIIEEAAKNTKIAKTYLEDLVVAKKHAFSKETEKVLSSLSQTFGAPSRIYSMNKLADMKFDNFTVDGKEYPLSYTLYEGNYCYEADTAVRRAAFDAFSKKLREYENTNAAIYNTQLQYEKTMATLRGYDSVIDYLLESQKVSRDMYNRQIDIIMEELAPHMRKYAQTIKKFYNLDKMTFADLKLPLDDGFAPSLTMDEAKDYLIKGLSILGEDTVEMINQAFDERWIDFAQNIGKSTGGFCSPIYDLHAYILLTWNARMSDVMTLAHELGHANHFRLCNGAQSVYDAECTMYFVEAPSTCNELIMAHSLLNNNDDPRFRRWLLATIVGKTYYHNFVTHLLEAHYQRKVYEIIDNGGSVNANILNKLKRDTLEQFWGEEIEINEGAELTWMRQGHYYRGLYSYTYSAGLTVGTEVVKRIEEFGKPAVEAWVDTMRKGGSLIPADLAKNAGVDITTDQPLKSSIATIGEYIAEIDRLTDLLEGK